MLTVGLLFWILYIVGFLVFGYFAFRERKGIPESLFWWALVFLLGVGTFGWPIK